MTSHLSTTRTRRLLALAAAGVMLTTGACSAGSEKRADTKSGVGSTSRPDAGATTVRETGDSTSKTPATASSKPTKKEILATTNGQQRASPNDGTQVPLRLDITGVKRLSGNTVEVTFDLTNTSDASEDTTYKPYSTMADPTPVTAGYDVGGVALLDRPNDKKYLTLYDTGDVCLCSDVGDLELEAGKSVSLYADVTAPPKSTSTVDFSLPGFTPIIGLEIR